ncbi:receptor-interacting serine/threonine-protein kinase 3-like [Cololabis saira]|uniref:receptor-interacting serine/threonine-protein kinase 3-like n=1 Tax=Cololabis saira TaxID=129043 RepID=UPI002AD227C4|nr:receptor-interacting serine/threonine-protein kinase 3-like [Cololabis saira]XP_061577969.1 receptor-interacting serine/threonine-protein kinase 3-like [Cololabis saira]XP_061577970.1 receptor-interacting serine/threonine-protein kinase 3-like [Cololabis saira]
MALFNRDPVRNEDLENWDWIASGGFGNVYKARHNKWCSDVAIKLLNLDARSILPQEKALYNEATHMEKVSSDFVLRVYGIYEGCPPIKEMSVQQGIVTPLMRKGSIENLQTDFPDPLPWPLVFRLAHEVGLGMTFLHSKDVLHHDLKPSNVLLDDDLRVKLADFGLSRTSVSALSSSQETQTETGGSYKYMPPEAFNLSYKPRRSFDIYSYGILLWSIINGEEPYPGKIFIHVKLSIETGQRPRVDTLSQKNVDGMKEIVNLMQRCWDADPSKRPPFTDCIKVTEELFSKHKNGIREAVYKVVTKLESETSAPDYLNSPTPEESFDSVDHPAPAAQEQTFAKTANQQSTKTMTEEDKANFVDDNMAVLIQDTDMVMAITEEIKKLVHGEAYSRINAKETNQDKMRVLYQGPLRSGGKRVKAAFYDALKKHQPDLVERLSG